MLKLSVMGQSKLLHPFMKHFKQQPFYDLKSECSRSVVDSTSGLEEICAFFEFNDGKANSSRSCLWVNMKTPDGKEVRFHLLDGNVVDMGDGSVVIYGKNYDIFSCKKPPAKR